MPSTFFNDFIKGLETYPTSHVTIRVIDFEILPGQGSVLNIDDIFRFKVSVLNKSHVEMENVTLHLFGQYADVALAENGPYLPELNFPGKGEGFTLKTVGLRGAAHTTDWFYGRARDLTGTSNVEKMIIIVTIHHWEANLDHMLRNCTAGGTVKGVLKQDIWPS